MTVRNPTAKTRARIAKLLGTRAAWRINKGATDAEGRKAAREELPELNRIKEAAKLAMEARRAELLQDPEYRRLVEQYRGAREASERRFVRSTRCPISVGVAGDLFFTVKAEGDTWDEVLDKLERA